MNTPAQLGPDDLHPATTETRIAVMATEIGHISKTLERIEQNGAHAVPRAEWEQRNAYVDLRFLDAFAQIAAVKQEAASRRAPWWTIVAAGAGALAVIAYLIDIIPSVVN